MFSSKVATAEIRAFGGSALPSSDGEAERVFVGTTRQDEFAAGRRCCVAVLNALGSHSTTVGRAHSGAPRWPHGVVGSISHTATVAAVAAGRSTDMRGIGIDIESIGAVDEAMWPILFADAELMRLQEADACGQAFLATTLFAAKEAFYKAQWPITHEWLDFLDIEIDIRGTTFHVHPRTEKNWTKILGTVPSGTLASTDELTAAAIVIPR